MDAGNKRKFAKALSLFTAAAGCAVVAGWVFDIGFLKSVSPSWISMKFPTALAFIASGITLYFIVRAIEGDSDTAQVVLFTTTLIILLLMGTFFFSAVLRIHTGFEELFIKDPADATTVVPGRPSIPTMLNFILMALAGILTMMNAEKFRDKLKAIGIAVGSIGALAVIGYIIGAPLLYYYVEGINSAIAFHTAGLFVVLGTGLLCL